MNRVPQHALTGAIRAPLRYCRVLCAAVGWGVASASCASPVEVTFSIQRVDADGTGEEIGQVVVRSSPHGAVFMPQLRGLPPGLHGFHLHETADCSPAIKDGRKTAAAAAGGHYDPEDSGRHGHPWSEGHRGDLPPLYVDGSGNAQQPVLAPRIKVQEVKNRALMIHAGGDNHSDHPEPLGGGGERIACGVAQPA